MQNEKSSQDQDQSTPRAAPPTPRPASSDEDRRAADLADCVAADEPDKSPTEATPLVFTYKNWRGEISERSVYPIRIEFGATEWHPEPQWLLVALDLEKGAEQSFAMKDIVHECAHIIEPAPDLAAENARLREAVKQCRLAFAGMVSVQSAIDKLDALNGGDQ